MIVYKSFIFICLPLLCSTRTNSKINILTIAPQTLVSLSTPTKAVYLDTTLADSLANTIRHSLDLPKMHNTLTWKIICRIYTIINEFYF